MAEVPIKVDTGSGGPRMVTADFPGNSHKEAERPKTQKVASGKVTVKKRGLARAIAESFTGDDRKNIGEYIIFDFLIPAAKVALIDGLEMFLGVDTRSRRRNDFGRGSSPQKPKVSYGSYFDEPRNSRRAEPSRRRYDLVDVQFDSRSDAIVVLNQLMDILEEYRMVSVSDYYDAAGIESTYVDADYGWTNLRNAIIVPSRGAYIIEFPRVEPLK